MGKMTKAQIAASLSKLEGEIGEAIMSANTMRDKVQHALVGCVSHWKLTGSNEGLADLVNHFINELGQGVNLQAVKAWCEKHLHMMEHTEGKKLVFKAVKVSALDTAKAAEEKWWSLKQQTVFSFDLTQQIVSLANKAAKAAARGEAEADAEVSIEPEIMDALNALAKQAQEASCLH